MAVGGASQCVVAALQVYVYRRTSFRWGAENFISPPWPVSHCIAGWHYQRIGYGFALWDGRSTSVDTTTTQLDSHSSAFPCRGNGSSPSGYLASLCRAVLWRPRFGNMWSFVLFVALAGAPSNLVLRYHSVHLFHLTA